MVVVVEVICITMRACLTTRNPVLLSEGRPDCAQGELLEGLAMESKAHAELASGAGVTLPVLHLPLRTANGAPLGGPPPQGSARTAAR